MPILIHGGRGLPPIADDLRRVVDRHPGATLIIAHGGIADLAALADAFAGHPGVYFDTSIWGAVDVLDLYSRVSPEQILYASDYPYGVQPQSLLLDLRIARLAGYSADELLGVLGGNAARIADGMEQPAPGAPKHANRRPVAADSVLPDPHIPDDGDAARLDAAGGRHRGRRSRAERRGGA